MLFVSLKKIYFWGSACVFLRVTLLKVIGLTRFQENNEIFKDLIQTFGSPPPHNPKSEKKSHKSTDKKILA